MSTFIAKKQKSAKSNSEPSSNGSSPPASVNLTNGNNMNHVSNNNNLNAANNNNNNAPKYGTLVPNRVFVGGISSTTTETELCQLFSKYGNVKATKIIADRAGVSKGYGFVTFETDEEAKRLQLDADNIILKERRLNIAPAIIKQAFPPRGFEATASPPPMTQQVYFQNGVPYTYQNGMAFFLTPQSQPAPLPAAPDASMFPGAGYAPTQGPSQTYAPAMMYPCANPAPMFISPQYPQYQPMPMSNQSAQLMYTTTNLQTSNNGADATSPIPMSSHGTAPYYVSHGEMRQEVFYNMPPGPNQGYPYSAPPLMMTNLHDPTIQYCDLSSEQPNNNVPNEVVQQPIPDENLPPQDQTDPNPDATNHENSEQPQRSRINSETPIVSLRNLQKIEDSDSNRGGRFRNNNRQGGDNRHNRFSNAANNNTSQGGEVNVNDRGAWQRRNRGGGRGGASMAVTIPKYPFNNNNNPSVANNNNYTKTGDMQQGNMQGRGGYRGANVGNRGSYRMNHQNGRRVITRSSTPSPNDPYNNSFSNPNITVHTSTQFQVAQPHPQPFIQGRNVQLTYHHPGVAAAGGNSMPHVHAYAAAHHPSAHPPPPIQQQLHQSSVPSRRFASTTNRRNNQNNNTHQSSTKKRGDIDNGAAGDAPVQNLITPPTTPAISKGSPSPTVSSSDQELICSGVKNLSVQ